MKLRDMSAAFMLLESEMNGAMIAKYIRELYANAGLRQEMQKASRGLGRPEACGRIVDIALSLVKNANSGRRGERIVANV